MISVTAVSPSQGLYVPRTITGLEVYSNSGIRISDIVVICRCVCVGVCVWVCVCVVLRVFNDAVTKNISIERTP